MAYPLDFSIAVLWVPLTAFLVELAFWLGIFHASGTHSLAGFSEAHYVTYLLWILMQLGGASWQFERDMIAEINTGAVNAFLLRPGTFYEYHLGQMFAIKLCTLLLTIPIALLLAYAWSLPLHYERLPPAILMGFCYLVFIYTLSFVVASMAFFYDNVYSLNWTKNMLLWFVTGEIFPLDLFPAALRDWLILSPFSCGTFLPAGYISGRISTATFMQGFVQLALGMAVIGCLARFVWKKGLKQYSGTGA